MSADRVAQEIIKAMNTRRKTTSAYDTKGEVVRITEDIAWVHFVGGVDETPVELTMGARVGDTVQVRVSGGRAWITGNNTEPPVGEKKIQEEIKKIKKPILKEVDEEIINIINNTNIPVPTPSDIDITPDDTVNVFIPKREFTSKVHDVTDKVEAGSWNKGIDLVPTKVYRIDIKKDSRYISDLHVYANYANSKSELSLNKYWYTRDADLEYGSCADDGQLFSTKSLAVSAQNNMISLRPQAYDSSWSFYGPVGLTTGIVTGNIEGTGYYASAGDWDNAVYLVDRGDEYPTERYMWLYVKPSYLSSGWTGITVSYKEIQ